MRGDPLTESPNQASGIYNSDSKSEHATVIYYYDAKEEDELTLRAGDVIEASIFKNIFVNIVNWL